MSKISRIIILNHGEFGKALVKSAEMILGPIENIYVFSLLENQSLESLIDFVGKGVSQMDEDTIILTDLKGGTPNHAATYFNKKYKSAVISGMNLPLLLELVCSRVMISNTKELVHHALQAGVNGIQLLSQ